MSDAAEMSSWLVALIFACCALGSFAILALGCAAAYRNGARDGWRAANHRNDPLWNDLRKWLRSVCGCSNCTTVDA